MLGSHPVDQGKVLGPGELLKVLEAQHLFDWLEGSGAHAHTDNAAICAANAIIYKIMLKLLPLTRFFIADINKRLERQVRGNKHKKTVCKKNID